MIDVETVRWCVGIPLLYALRHVPKEKRRIGCEAVATFLLQDFQTNGAAIPQ